MEGTAKSTDKAPPKRKPKRKAAEMEERILSKAKRMPTEIKNPKGAGIQEASTRMQVLAKAAHHLFIVNHPEQPVDMGMIQAQNLDVTEQELPVLKQLIRDEKEANGMSTSDTEDLPSPSLPTNPMEEEKEIVLTLMPESKEPSKDLNSDQNVESPSAKRSKVLINTSAPTSPIIQSKKPDRAMGMAASTLTALKGWYS